MASYQVFDAILGMEFLDDGKCNLNIGAASLRYGKHKITLIRTRGGRWCLRVLVTEQVTLPAESCTRIPARIAAGNRRGDTRLPKNREIAPDVHLARTAYGKDERNTGVQLINLSKT